MHMLAKCIKIWLSVYNRCCSFSELEIGKITIFIIYLDFELCRCQELLRLSLEVDRYKIVLREQYATNINLICYYIAINCTHIGSWKSHCSASCQPR
jgi:hypothetical protein